MLGATYSKKKFLKASIGQKLRFVETCLYGTEYKPNGKVYVVGPCPYTAREWYAEVTMEKGLIVKVK